MEGDKREDHDGRDALQEEPEFAAAFALLHVVPQSRLGQEKEAKRQERYERQEDQDFEPRRLPQARMHAAHILLEKRRPKAQGSGCQMLDDEGPENQAAGGMDSPHPAQLLAFAGTAVRLFGLLSGRILRRMMAATAGRGPGKRFVNGCYSGRCLGFDRRCRLGAFKRWQFIRRR
jgi:hypothetical protein